MFVSRFLLSLIPSSSSYLLALVVHIDFNLPTNLNTDLDVGNDLKVALRLSLFLTKIFVLQMINFVFRF